MGPALLAWVLVRRAHAGRRLPPEDADAEGRRRQRPDVPPAGEGLGRQSPTRWRGTRPPRQDAARRAPGAGAVPPPGWRQSNFLLCLAAQQGALCSGSPASPRDGRTQKCSQDWTLRYILSCTLMHARARARTFTQAHTRTRARARTHSSPSLRLILTLCLLGPRSLPRPPRPHGQRPPRVITALSSSLVISAT